MNGIGKGSEYTSHDCMTVMLKYSTKYQIFMLIMRMGIRMPHSWNISKFLVVIAAVCGMLVVTFTQ